MATETTATEVTEFEDGSKIIETKTVESEYIEGDGVDYAEPIEVEAVEEVTDAAVQIAEIEAERDITIAAIQADVQTAAIEQREDEEDDQWRQNIEARQAELSEKLDLLLAMQSTPPPSQEQPPSQPENPASESPEVTPESLEADAAPEPPKRPKKSRWI